jgi:hypothetical protein
LAQTLDTYYKYVSALFKGDKSDAAPNGGTPFVTDASTNALVPSMNGSIRNDSFSPFLGDGYYGVSFDGATNSISAASNAGFGFSGQFTVEGWFNWRATPTAQGTLIGNGTAGTFGLENTAAGGPLVVVNYGNINITPSSTFTPAAGAWVHIAVTRDAANLVTLWINGVANTSATYAGTFTAGAFVIGGTTNFANVSVSNLRVVNGSALYTSAFTPLTTPLTAVSGTVLLTCQSSRFVDKSSNALTISRTGFPAITQFIPFATPATPAKGGSMSFGGYAATPTPALVYPSSSLFAFSGDFTVEYWYYTTNIASGANVQVDFRTSTAAGNFVDAVGSSTPGDIAVTPGGASATGVVIANQWNHIAWARSSGTLNIFVNGTLVKSAQVATTQAATTLTVGTNYPLSAGLALAYMSNLRIQNGFAQYTTAFTPPSDPLSTTANTVLLTAQGTLPANNRGFLDSSGANYLMTVSGVGVTQSSVTPYSSNGHSSYFDGTGAGAVSYPSNTGFGFASGVPFTFEGWFNWQVKPSLNSPILGVQTAGGLVLYYISGKGISINIFGGSSPLNGTFTPTPGTWYHIAVTRNASNRLSIWINGVETNFVTDATSYTAGAWTVGSGSGATNMYMSNFRVVNGYCLYTSTFVPNATTPLTSIAGAVLLTGQAPSTFVDYGPNSLAPTIGSAASSQPQSPYRVLPVTTSSALFSGSGSYLSTSTSTDQAVSNGAYTVECFFNPSLLPTGSAVQSLVDATTAGGIGLQLTSTGFQTVQAASGTTGTVLTGSALSRSFTPGTWYHIAIVRTNTNTNGTAAYVNGSLVRTYTDVTTYGTSGVRLAAASNGTANFSGYLSNCRIANTAVYSAPFTTPTGPLALITGTQFLTLNANNTVQQVSVQALTQTGPVRMTTVTPFGVSVPSSTGYTTANVGGSLYFSGGTNYLTVSLTGRAALTNPFVLEMWVLPTVLNAVNTIWTNRASTTATDGFDINVTSANTITVATGSGVTVLTSTTKVGKTWTHIALYKTGTTMYLYVNGVFDTSATYSTSLTQTNARIGINAAAANPLTGYVAGLRWSIVSDTTINGVNSGIYYPPSMCFMPRQSPISAIASTGLLLAGTNAAAIDTIQQSPAATVGNATVSISRSKFGGSSMYFPGTTSDYISIADSPNNQLRLEDFTIEGWFYRTSGTGTLAYLATKGNPGTTGWAIGVSATNVLLFTDTSTTYNGSTTISLNTWYHCALTRSGTTYRLFLNGNLETTQTITSDYNQTTALLVGTAPAASPFAGYIDDLRITKGYARYTAAFTPPATGFPTA